MNESSEFKAFLQKVNAFRATHLYPRLAALVAAIYQTLLALLAFLTASTMLAAGQDVAQVGRTMSNFVTVMTVFGLFAGVFGVLFAWVAIGLFLTRHSIFIPAITLNSIWFLLIALSQVRNLEAYFSLVGSAVLVFVFLRDARVQAIFGRGKFAETYWLEDQAEARQRRS